MYGFPRHFSFHIPTAIEFGWGALARLPGIVAGMGGSRVIVVGDPGVAKAGLVDRVVATLTGAGLHATPFTDVQSDPDVRSVERGTLLAKQAECDAVVGIGGGSALDTAKAIGLMMTNPGGIRDYVGIGKVKVPAAPVVAIPTTSGTGSELTIWSVLTDSQNGTKISVGSVLNCPRVGLLDPELTVSLPPFITAQTGMDALTHAVESYVNTASHVLSEAQAEKAIQLIGRSLRQAVAHGHSADARAEMLLASTLAGMAFNATRLGYVHAFALPLGARFKIPHGLVNAIMLPVVMGFNLPGNVPAFARVAALLGENVAGLSEREAASRSVVAVEQLKADTGITQTLADFGLTEARFDEVIDEALKSGNCIVNPRQATREDLRAMLERGCAVPPVHS
ncbi:MAG: iron-containing alcohol dehydrogenase [Janthinobacterium lividum]